ncbi:hypothetical protein EX30DRAFT_299863, partial [Ascodesmis nigricans]
MGWFWADSSASETPSSSAPASISTSSCPVRPRKQSPPPPTDAASASGCPVRPSAKSTATLETASESACPVKPSDRPDINPLNLMFSNLPQTPYTGQKTALPTEREKSSIPRGDQPGTTWEYPSPQQMYNAMRRKGYEDAPEDAVEVMTAVHNWLNEGAWQEIVDWEHRFKNGAIGYLLRNEKKAAKEAEEPQLMRFEGRRNDVTPKATLYGWLGRIAPNTYGGPPPFDRHDWYVKSGNRETRYVIDYYSGGEENGMPIFFLDVRPALDRPGLAAERLVKWGEELWQRASGSDVRQQAREEARR